MTLMQSSDWVYGLKHLEITQKKRLCDVHMFFVEETIEAVSPIAKSWPQIKIKWIF